jgi:hypothetical protein
MLLSGEPFVSTHQCCVVTSAGMDQKIVGVRIAGGGPHLRSFVRRSVDLTAKITPVAILAVLPKCPACLAAYVALGTGIGLSLTAATYIRWSLLLLCVASLVYFAIKAVRPKAVRLKPGGMRIFR